MRPLANWFAPRHTTSSACTSARAAPTIPPPSTPSQGFPVSAAMMYAVSAPPSIPPSVPRLMTPERCDTVSPRAA
jgi:hypothetical protein